MISKPSTRQAAGPTVAPAAPQRPTRAGGVLVATVGSVGDVHPFLSLGQALQRQGHAVRFMASPVHAERVHASGPHTPPEAALALPADGPATLLVHPLLLLAL